ncbi:MAG: outer membrane protein assembly factor BamC [Gemmatimonadota bacterium]
MVNLMRAARRAGILVLVAVVAGCSSIGLSTDKIEYKSVATAKPLDVPPDLSQIPRDDRYAVPDRPGVASASAGAATRPGAAATQTVVPVNPRARIERDGSERWLAVDVTPEQAFTVVKEFWPSVGLSIASEDPAAGVIETNWAENRAKLPQDIIRRTIGRVFDGLYSTGEQDKFRTRIERTSKNTAEIYISHRGMVEVYTSPQKDRTVWQPRPADPELEAEMLQRLALRFAPPPATAAAPGAAAAAPTAAATTTPEIGRLVRGSDGRAQRVDINEPFDRAWRRVGLALDRGGFTVEDRDRTKGTYFVRYLDPEVEAKQRESQGFFSRMFGREPKVDAQQFRVMVASSGQASAVTVLDKDGKPDTGATAQKILGQINEQLK